MLGDVYVDLRLVFCRIAETAQWELEVRQQLHADLLMASGFEIG